MGHKGSMAHKYNAAAYMMDGAAAEGSPNANLNKGYGYESPGQERENLGKMPGAYKQMDSGGSFMSKHSQSRIGGGSPLMQKKKMVEVDGKMVPSYAADGKGANDLK
tara:strand:+ start:88 stop:408 length:321 start_codon:yes stop_codon:yes gene_type:complete